MVIRDREVALEERAAVHEHTREARAREDMTQREAQGRATQDRSQGGELVYHSGYEKPLALKGARFLCELMIKIYALFNH